MPANGPNKVRHKFMVQVYALTYIPLMFLTVPCFSARSLQKSVQLLQPQLYKLPNLIISVIARVYQMF